MVSTEQVLARAKVQRLKVMQIRMQYQVFLRTKVNEIVKEFIVNRIKLRMDAAGYNQKIIDGVDVGFISIRGKEIKIRIISEYFADNGFDVAIAMERGTKDHWVEPKDSATITAIMAGAFTKKQALHWKVEGKDFFSKGHVTGGIPAHRIVRDTVSEFGPQVKEKIRSALAKWRNDIINT